MTYLSVLLAKGVDVGMLFARPQVDSELVDLSDGAQRLRMNQQQYLLAMGQRMMGNLSMLHLNLNCQEPARLFTLRNVQHFVDISFSSELAVEVSLGSTRFHMVRGPTFFSLTLRRALDDFQKNSAPIFNFMVARKLEIWFDRWKNDHLDMIAYANNWSVNVSRSREGRAIAVKKPAVLPFTDSRQLLHSIPRASFQAMSTAEHLAAQNLYTKVVGKAQTVLPSGWTARHSEVAGECLFLDHVTRQGFPANPGLLARMQTDMLRHGLSLQKEADRMKQPINP